MAINVILYMSSFTLIVMREKNQNHGFGSHDRV